MAQDSAKNQNRAGLFERIRFAFLGERDGLDPSIQTRTVEDGMRGALSAILPVEDKTTLHHAPSDKDMIPMASFLPQVVVDFLDSLKVERKFDKLVAPATQAVQKSPEKEQARAEARKDKKLQSALEKSMHSWVPQIFRDFGSLLKSEKENPYSFTNEVRAETKGWATRVISAFTKKDQGPVALAVVVATLPTPLVIGPQTVQPAAFKDGPPLTASFSAVALPPTAVAVAPAPILRQGPPPLPKHDFKA
jgi:hypothetical protein